MSEVGDVNLVSSLSLCFIKVFLKLFQHPLTTTMKRRGGKREGGKEEEGGREKGWS